MPNKKGQNSAETDANTRFVFPKEEQDLVIGAAYALVSINVLIAVVLIWTSIVHCSMDGIYFLLFLTFLFVYLVISVFRNRKYIMATWEISGSAVTVYIKDSKRIVRLDQTVCVSMAQLAFSRRYGSAKYPFIMLWEPGQKAPYEEMWAYMALKKREAVIIPCNEDVLEVLRKQYQIDRIPSWPKSSVYTIMDTNVLQHERRRRK